MGFFNGVPSLGSWSKKHRQQKHTDLNDLFVDRAYHKFTKFILISFSLGVFLYRLVENALNCEYTKSHTNNYIRRLYILNRFFS